MNYLEQCILRLEQYQTALQNLQDGLISGMVASNSGDEMKASSFVLSQNHTAVKEINEALALLKKHQALEKKNET